MDSYGLWIQNKQAGIEGLFLTRDSLRGDWPTRIMNQIEGIIKGRLDKFYNRRTHISGK